MMRKRVCLVAGLLFLAVCLAGCAGRQGASPSPVASPSPQVTASPAPSPSPGITVTPEQAAQVIGETPEKVFMENELQGTMSAGKAIAIALPENTGATWKVNADDGVEELPDGTLNPAGMASDGQGTSPSPASSPGESPAQSPAESPGASPAGEASPSPGGAQSPAAEGNYHVWGFRIAEEGEYSIRISNADNAASEKTFTITVQAAS